MKRNSLLLVLAFAAALFAYPAIMAQEDAPAPKRAAKSKIIVPEYILAPQLTEEDIEARLKLFTDWIDQANEFIEKNPPATFKKNFQQFVIISDAAAQMRLEGLRDLALEPELEEVTKCYRQYYKDIYNAALPAYECAKNFDVVVENPTNQSQVVQGNQYVLVSTWAYYKKRFQAALNASREIIKQGPKKMPAAEWKKIVKENRAARAKKYIADMEKAIADGKMTLAEVNARASAKPSPAPAAKKPAQQTKPEKKKTTKTRKDKQPKQPKAKN